MLRPDSSHAPDFPFTGVDSLYAAWGAAIDGNDQVWISNLVGSNLVHLCGVRTETCPPGMKTGDPISPLGGYVGGDMQWLTDVAIDPAGNLWVANNWQDSDSCFGHPLEAVSTRCGGNGVTIFYGMAKPVHAPQITLMAAVALAEDAPTAAREFRVELLPAGTVKTVTYNGRLAGVGF